VTFEEMLAQVVEVLRREHRVSYRALRRRFGLDEEYLEDLKIESIRAKQLATDEDNTILVWAGDATPTSVSAPERPPLAYTPAHLSEKILTTRTALDRRITAGLALVEQGVEHVVARGRASGLAPAVVCLSEVYLLAGRLKEARQRAAQAIDLARQYQQRGTHARALWLLGESMARQASSEAAPTLATTARPLPWRRSWACARSRRTASTASVRSTPGKASRSRLVPHCPPRLSYIVP
jgi:hypothetical protein